MADEARPLAGYLFHESERVTLYHGDCRDVMAAMPEDSVDSIVCDPPYGLEFMGKEWDKFRVDASTTGRWRGERAGAQGHLTSPDDVDRHGKVSYGGQRSTTARCVTCGKRDAFRNPHPCGDRARWVVEPVDPYAAPASMLAFQEWSRTWALQALRVLKPGGYILAFGGSRTFHRLACAVEEAGFELRDEVALFVEAAQPMRAFLDTLTLEQREGFARALDAAGASGYMSWVFGSGFPKSLDVSKAVDAELGAAREQVRRPASKVVNPKVKDGHLPGSEGDKPFMVRAREVGYHEHDGDEPVTEEARRLRGWGTALKPAHEPIVMGRKPLRGTVAENVLAYGTGAVNVDGCRIGITPEDSKAMERSNTPNAGRMKRGGSPIGTFERISPSGPMDTTKGRWPANVLLLHAEGCVKVGTRRQHGVQKAAGSTAGFRGGDDHYALGTGAEYNPDVEVDDYDCVEGCPVRLVDEQSGETTSAKGAREYTASPNYKNKVYGRGMGGVVSPSNQHLDSGGASRFFYSGKATRADREGSKHPTVKPVELMGYLVALVTPPGGVVLDPFCGSGSTVRAARERGFRVVACDRERTYLEDAARRLRQEVLF